MSDSHQPSTPIVPDEPEPCYFGYEAFGEWIGECTCGECTDNELHEQLSEMPSPQRRAVMEAMAKSRK